MPSVGSNIMFASSATVPSKLRSDANSSGSVVRASNHHRGWSAMSNSVREVIDGGTVRPLRTSRSRLPATAVSTVSTRAW